MKRETLRKHAALLPLSLAAASAIGVHSAFAATASWGGTNRVLGTNTFWMNSTLPGASDEAYFGTLSVSGGVPQTLAFKGTGTTPTTINLSWGSAVFDATQINSGTLEIESSLSTTNTGAATLTLNGDGVATDDVLQLSTNVTGTVDFKGSGATAGSPLTLNLGVGQVDVEAPTAMLELEGVVTGSVGITKVGAGVLYLFNGTGLSHTFTGGVTVNSGTVAFNNGNALGNPSNSTTINDGTLEYLPKTAASSGQLVATRSISLASMTSKIDITPGNALTILGSVSGTGALNKVDTGTLILAGSNSYSGGTNISAGTLQVGQATDTALLTSPLGTGPVTNSTTLFFSSSQATTISNSISGSGSVTQNGTGVTTLSSANNYAGGTNVSAGKLIVGAAGALASGSVSVTGGALQLAPGTGAGTVSSLSISGSGVVDVSNNRVFVSSGAGSQFSSIAALMIAGYDKGAWDGAGGINSSAIAANPAYSIGLADSAEPGNPAGVPAGQLEIAYTVAGDANLDGRTNALDFNALAANFGQPSGDRWTIGDFNYDGVVDSKDFAILSQGFGTVASAPSLDFGELSRAGALVPEPTSAGMLILGALAGLARRRRKDSDVGA